MVVTGPVCPVGKYFREGNQFGGHNLWVSAGTSSGKPRNCDKYLAAIYI